MNKKKILILGSSGMVGSSIVRNINKKKYQLLTPRRKELNLFYSEKVIKYFLKKKPDTVILAAAKVGGIYANSNFPADFIHENLKIQNNIIEACNQIKNIKLIFLGSSCIYPRNCKQPIKEEYLLNGSLEKTNEPYAIAKIAGIKMIQAYRSQYKKNYIALMPTNIYGPNDNFDEMNSHVIAGLIKKISDAKIKKKKTVKLWGSGKPLRDFLYVDDLAKAIILLMERYNGEGIINIGSGEEISINKLALKIKKKLNYNGKILFDRNFPDGTPRKILDINKIKKFRWRPTISIDEGLSLAINDYKKNFRNDD